MLNESDSVSPSKTPSWLKSPADEYQIRWDSRRAAALAVAARIDRLGLWRLGCFGLGLLVAAIGLFTHAFSPWWSLLVAVPLAVLFLLGIRLAGHQRWYERLARYYELGLQRLNGKWIGTGKTGEKFLTPNHLFAADLDLFGRGSLFERICTARTLEGETRLAGWFLAPATSVVIRDRQLAVAELRDRLDLRESLAATGSEIGEGFSSATLIQWGEVTRTSPASWRIRALLILGWINVIVCGGWLLADVPGLVLLATFLVSSAIAAPLRHWVFASTAGVEDKSVNLSALVTILHRFEREQFENPLLVRAQDSLKSQGSPASAQIAELARLAEWLAAGRNPMFIPFRILLFWDVRLAAQLEIWRQRCGSKIRQWIETVAELEALSSLAAYSFENPEDPFPELRDGSPVFVGTGLAHPLMNAAQSVRNDVRLGDGPQVLMISGSNMSGKSTLLRTVGVNTVLALAGGVVRAHTLTLSPLALAATLRVQDSLGDGRSRFFAEVIRVRESLEAARKAPVLFLFDELFAGTNSADRVRGAAGVVKALLNTGAIGLLTTHDLAVTELPEEMRQRVYNVHFADQWADGEMRFDHQMRPGVVPHTNGVALMRAVGLDV